MVGVTHDELRALCKAATPGPWGTHPDDPWEVQGNLAAYHGDDCEPVCTIRTDDAADATYIAAVSPDVVEGLLDEIARLKALLRFSVTPDAALTGCGGGTCEECDSWRSKVTEALRDS